ncbi:hypothetical protein HY230_01935 [Candidatus Acetothermia bacterium]|nr:hypothetical protein [Candidatus Acetothermia bacterium]
MIVLFTVGLILAAPNLLIGQNATGTQSTVLQTPLNISIDKTYTKDSDSFQMIIVTLYNQSAVTSIKNIELNIGQGTFFYGKQNLNELFPGQSQVIVFERIPNTAKDLLLFISYEFSSKPNSLAKSLELSNAAKQPIVWTTLAPELISGLLSLLGVVVGAALLHWFTSRRERIRSQNEWNKMLFEKNEGAYRAFLAGWNESTSAILLQNQFETLKATSFVPVTLIDSYKDTHVILSTPQTTPEQKQEACKALRIAFDRFIAQPWSNLI